MVGYGHVGAREPAGRTAKEDRRFDPQFIHKADVRFKAVVFDDIRIQSYTRSFCVKQEGRYSFRSG